MSSNVIEGNKLIAEFMGWSTHPQHGERYVINKDRNRKLPPHWSGIDNEGSLSDFKYHTSWDWLMPVVEKIESMGFCFGIVKNQVTILQETGRGNIRRKAIGININEENKKASLYKAVVEFIQWYNQTQTHAEK